MEDVLVVEDLEKSYGSIQALKPLSFRVVAGEIFGLLGPNGAGKTTALECILGTRKKDNGRIRMLGRDPLADRAKVFEEVGVQFQDSGWQAGIRVDELCRMMAALHARPVDWESLLGRFGLEKRRKKTVESLSGGERQKLSLLVAFMHKPRLVFLDELTTGLDPLARREVWDYIRLVRDEGTAVVLSSHYMDEVKELCSRALMLKEGSCIAHGSIGELIEQGRGKNLDEAWIQRAGA